MLKNNSFRRFEIEIVGFCNLNFFFLDNLDYLLLVNLNFYYFNLFIGFFKGLK